ncbi:MAG: LuxR C-terminal-related transcriptional regulator [Devosia sp.]
MTDDVYVPFYQRRDRLVHIVDADLGICESLSVLFRLEGLQTSFFTDLTGFFSALERRQPDVVVANMRLQGGDGLQLLRRLKTQRAGTPVFIMLDAPDVEAAVAAMKAGASDVLSKPIDGDRLTEAVREVLRHDVMLGRSQGGGRPVEVRGFSQLTPREREVLQLITNGQSNKEAGRELGISPRTIEVHRARVMEKLGARNTADLMRIVLTA